MSMKCASECKPPRFPLPVIFVALSLMTHVGDHTSQDLDGSFPGRVFRWGYLSKGKASLLSALRSQPSSSLTVRQTRETLQLLLVSHRHGYPRPPSTLTPLGEGLQDQLPPSPGRGYVHSS